MLIVLCLTKVTELKVTQVLLLQWFYKLVCFICYSQETQTALVKSCWSELFTLGLAQCANNMSLSTILMAILNHLQSALQQGKHFILTTISCYLISYCEMGYIHPS